MKTRHFEQLPKAYTAYPKVIQGLINKGKSKAKTLPQVEYVVDRLAIDAEHLHKYQKICNFPVNNDVPAMYLAVLAQSLQMHMMTSEPFPFVLLGLVHIRNQITQYRPILATEVLQLSCQFGELTPHDKGVQFDFIISAKVADELVFEGLTTYLSRQKVTEKPSENSKTDKKPDYQLKQTWRLAENTGRRYAMISGDFNLIHIHALTAKAFGFNNAIAHGMWSKARALADLAPLPSSYRADVWFKLPMKLPSQVALLTAASGKTTDFLVENVQSKKPHLVGELSAL
ncbi:MaoC like domain-containing protein [Acinetobacter marinus]|uniref:MaoC like domain-containing protein n=1 Tax=Acinetobacter marinus TaxID=281375 RepID=A0A1G6GT35_9GAMM|nr:MaoC/PaaZ C-terminal domain-containing protein [Acinetobacter marinus]SDB85043.1 MaoC like domain-containing protein [Acinetobacter marinus]